MRRHTHVHVTGSGSAQSKRELYNLLRRRTLQGLDDAPFGDGFVVGKVPLPLRFLFDGLRGPREAEREASVGRA